MGTMREMVPLFRGRRNRDDRLAAFGARRAAQEIHLPADAAVELVADGVGADLPGEIDLQRGIDGDHVVVAGDASGIVDIGGGVKFEDGIVVDKVKQLPGAESEAHDDLARLEVLALAGDDTGFNQRDDAVGNQFAVYAEIFAVHQERQHRVGNAADAGLKHRAVFNQAGDVARDGHMQVGDFRLFHGAQSDGRTRRWHRCR